MNATTDNTSFSGSPLPPPTPKPLPHFDPPTRERFGVWSTAAVAAASVGIALVWFPGGGHGRPGVDGPSLLELLGVLGGAVCGVLAVALAITVLAAGEPRGWRLALAISAIPIGVIACLMAAIVAFSG